MCPACIPTVAKALKAPRFCAIPAAAITLARSSALLIPNNATFVCAPGCILTAPPTKPTAIGHSILPTRFPSSSFSQ